MGKDNAGSAAYWVGHLDGAVPLCKALSCVHEERRKSPEHVPWALLRKLHVEKPPVFPAQPHPKGPGCTDHGLSPDALQQEDGTPIQMVNARSRCVSAGFYYKVWFTRNWHHTQALRRGKFWTDGPQRGPDRGRRDGGGN